MDIAVRRFYRRGTEDAELHRGKSRERSADLRVLCASAVNFI